MNFADEMNSIQSVLKEVTGESTVPRVFFKGHHVGGSSDLHYYHQKYDLPSLYQNNAMAEQLKELKQSFDYDLIVVGGGSGGLSAAKVSKL